MSQDEHRIGHDGVRIDGVSTYPIDAHDRQLLDAARQRIVKQQMPVLLRPSDPNDRLFVVAFDGTGNDGRRDQAHRTNVASVAIETSMAAAEGRGELHVGYVPGPGTQSNPVTRVIDGATGYSYDARLEEMYLKLIHQARDWLKKNPNARISLADIGFSRGAEQAAGFARLVHARGIADPDSRSVTRDADGNVVVSYSRVFVPPGRTAQVAVLIDPVPTGEPARHDRRLPPSVIAAVQFTSEDERRGLFRASRHVPFGTSDDGRFTNVWLPGAHSDLGGSYHRNGLATRTGNLLRQVLNATSDVPFLPLAPDRDDPRLDVVHRSEEGMLLYRLGSHVDRHGGRGTRDDLGGAACRRDCDRAEPGDPVLASGFAWRAVASAPQPGMAGVTRVERDMARTEIDALFDRISDGALRGDAEAARQAGRDYLRSVEGQALQRDAAELVERSRTPSSGLDPARPRVPRRPQAEPALQP